MPIAALLKKNWTYLGTFSEKCLEKMW